MIKQHKCFHCWLVVILFNTLNLTKNKKNKTKLYPPMLLYDLTWHRREEKKRKKEHNTKSERHINQWRPTCGRHLFFLKPLTRMSLSMNYGLSNSPCAATCIVHQPLYNINTVEEQWSWCWGRECECGPPWGGGWDVGIIDWKHTLFRMRPLGFMLCFTGAESQTRIFNWHIFINKPHFGMVNQMVNPYIIYKNKISEHLIKANTLISIVTHIKRARMC